MRRQCIRLEYWRPAVGYRGYYEVSSWGRVRRIGRGKGSKPGRILRPRPLKNGRLRVHLSRDNIKHDTLIHHVVAFAFIGPRPTPKHEINHRDGDPGNNRASNLEWVTRKQNIQHAFEHGFIPPPVIRFRCHNAHINCSGERCFPNGTQRCYHGHVNCYLVHEHSHS
jgi:hypothetical protein